MISANELMIGNYVTHSIYSSRSPSKEPFQVTVEDFGYASLIDAIPLTDEWLIKCGFERTETKFNKTDVVMIDYRFGNMVVYGKFGVHYEVEFCLLDINERTYIARIKHIHQLQNLYFALTGKQLKIKI